VDDRLSHHDDEHKPAFFLCPIAPPPPQHLVDYISAMFPYSGVRVWFLLYFTALDDDEGRGFER
jgi:hypothetical protein